MKGELPQEDEARCEVQDKFAPQLEFNARVVDLSIEAIEGIKAKNVNVSSADEGYFYRVVLGLFVKAIKTCRSIALLCGKGLASDSDSLLRTAVEAFIAFEWICEKSTIERAKLYCLHLRALVKKNRNVYKKDLQWQKIMPGLDPMYDQASREYDRDFSMLPRNLKPKNRKSLSRWAETSLEAKAKELRLSHLYNIVYRSASEVVHAQDLVRHARFDASFDLQLFIALPEPYLDSPLSLSPIILVDMLEKINELFALGLEAEIRAAQDEAKGLLRSGTGALKRGNQ